MRNAELSFREMFDGLRLNFFFNPKSEIRSRPTGPKSFLSGVLVQALIIFLCVVLPYGAAADGATLQVPEGGYATIQEAIDAASNGDTVLVADGVYKGLGNRNLDFRGKAIVVRSEKGPRHTIINCEGEARGFYFHGWEKRTSVVSGFTITHGYDKDEGGGIYCYKSSPTITDCRITECTVRLKGGGVYCSASSSPVFVDCTISNNSSEQGGGMYVSLSSPSLTRCVISNNRATGVGGGVYSFLSPMTLDRCTVSGNAARNAGGGIYCNASNPTITGSTISANRANSQGGGIYCLSASPELTNCLITENGAGLGAGIYSAALSVPELTHCLFNGNTATDRGGAVYCNQSSPTIINSILWGDSPDEIYEEGFASPHVHYSDIQGDYPGEGNIDADPMFLGEEDYRLQASSLCLDHGANHAPKLPLTDKDGNARIINGVADMGAFELTPYALTSTGRGLIRHPDGLSIPVIQHAVKGHLAYAKVKDDNVTFAGWAADAKNAQLPEAVVIFLDGRFFYADKTEVDRPDVAKFLKNPALKKTGFKFDLTSSFPNDTLSPEVRLFAVSKKGTASELIYPKGYQWGKKWYVLSGNRLIRHPDSLSIPVDPKALKGHLAVAKAKGDHVRFAGWAADVKGLQVPEAIMIFANGESVFSGTCNTDRPDVAEVFHNPALRNAGFNYAVPRSLFKDMAGADVRVFALSRKGVASELVYPKGYPWRKKWYALSGSGLIRYPDGTSIPLDPKALKGHLSVAKTEGDRVMFAGWAADVRDSQVPEAVVIFLDGQFFFSGRTDINRPDVAKYLKNPALKKTGFKFDLTFSAPNDASGPEFRLFAVSKKGVASELIYPKGYQWGKK